MALALVKRVYCAIMGTSPDTTSFEFKTMLELKQFLAQYASSEGSQIAVSLFKVEYK